GDEIKTKVEEITTNEIKYKKFDNLEGPTYSIQKSEVFIIKYANGTKDVINQETKAAPATSNTYSAVTTTEEPKGSPKIDIDGNKYYQYNRRLSTASLQRIIQESNKQDAIKEIKAAKVLGNIGKPFIIASIPLMIVGVVGSAIGGLLIAVDDSYYSGTTSVGASVLSVGVPVAVLGVACLTTGIILNGSSNGKTKKAVALYNNGL
ncbi:MAG: hypothetical protein K2Q22_04070, partial [Cytophagales bacterium]|nr:hypothetical protein [Cytophagales bacterium]